MKETTVGGQIKHQIIVSIFENEEPHLYMYSGELGRKIFELIQEVRAAVERFYPHNEAETNSTPEPTPAQLTEDATK